MDLTTMIGDTRLRIRSAGIVKSANGYLFSKSDQDYIFVPGGKVMTGESSLEGIKREIMEELGIVVENLKLISVIENFYTSRGENVHEICFVYEIQDIFTGIIPPEFIEVGESDLDNHLIQPKIMKEIIINKDKTFQHIVIK